MGTRATDGSAGDADYGAIGASYAGYRQPDPRIAAAITDALGEAHTVLNVGAGAGSYEPADRQVTAVEPSAFMRAQRREHPARAIDATAEQLPFADDSFDASMSTFSVHQWRDVGAGLREMRRVTRGPVVILTCDPTRVEEFWLREYAPEVLATEARRYPSLEILADGLGGRFSSRALAIPQACTDGFTEAYFGRPERLLEAEAQRACSAWSLVAPAVITRFTEQLTMDLLEGTWDAKHGELRTRSQYEGSLVLVVSEP
ncbi:ubiquinone biosynthesis protein [Brachybacterium sp. P6-10-X1]|uniref:class I SAM-dependent methyltransferase n=1 Tax=Brachybacterium sp. P6-10-X1 TaxID=1903186 RepID=UPI000971BAED|nr:class I SAM-dependent methyltransferase [Brachybacterium sp. P6-10-X1]APX31435.1 ubiquinone biosynthesis protein [Brachybacterium sp. P6-10-X1]